MRPAHQRLCTDHLAVAAVQRLERDRELIVTLERVAQLGPDSVSALVSRYLFLEQMKHTWLGREDTSLTDRLLGELPGIADRAHLHLPLAVFGGEEHVDQPDSLPRPPMVYQERGEHSVQLPQR